MFPKKYSEQNSWSHYYSEEFLIAVLDVFPSTTNSSEKMQKTQSLIAHLKD